ncbi:MAG: sulfotransferase domain-containing protein [Rubrobacteraceae bacterium]
MPFPPEACLIGAQKAGTTTLAYLIDQHPQVAVVRPKEPHFFTHNWDKGLDWYEKKFPGPPGAVRVDASTSYSMAPLSKAYARSRQEDYKGVPGRVSSVNPNVKLIYLLRDPVERTYSGYWHDARMGGENRDFTTALLNNAFYLDVSDYHGQLLLWLQVFPLSSFFFVLFEDLREDPERVTRECWKFLGVNEEAGSAQLDLHENQSYQVSWAGRKMNRLATTYPAVRATLKPIVPKGVQKLLKTVKTGSMPIPPMKEEDRNFLLDYFREKNADIAALTNQSLDKWQR